MFETKKLKCFFMRIRMHTHKYNLEYYQLKTAHLITMSQTQEIMECSICLDCIDGNKNQIITECGHCFHASCLMKNVSHNGFGCPYCRATMAEAPPDDDESDYSEYTDVEDDMYDDYSLRGMRWMFQRAEGEELDDDADDDEEVNAPTPVARLEEREEGEVEEDSDEEEENDPAVPSVDFIVYKLQRSRVTMEMLVKAMLALDHDEYADNREYNEMESNIFGRLRTIISNYRPQDQADMERNIEARRAHELAQQPQPVNQLGVFGRGVREL